MVKGLDLDALYAHAKFFVLPSYHEGLPISLLEAMSWKLPVLASSIAANLEVGLPDGHYFTAGDRPCLSQALCRFARSSLERIDYGAHMDPYDWDAIAESTARFYREVAGGLSLDGVELPDSANRSSDLAIRRGG